MKTVAFSKLCCIAIERAWVDVMQVEVKAIVNMALLKKSTRDTIIRALNRGYVGQVTGLAYELYHTLCTASNLPVNALGKNMAIITLHREHAIELEKEITALIKLGNPKVR